MWVEPITDRALSDIINRTPKGFFNVVDWIRINGNTEQINAMINVLRVLDIQFEILPEPTITTIPSVDDINRFVANIERVRQATNFPDITGLEPLVTTWQAGIGADAPDYETVNQWELDIQIIFNLIASSSDYMIWCGVANTGQIRYWQNHFRRWLYYVPEAGSPTRLARVGMASCGANLTDQNFFRRYA